MARTVSSYKFRNNLSSYFEEIVEDETPLVVSKFGKPIVVVSPYKKKKMDNIDKYFGFLPGDEDGVSFENRVRRSRKERKRVEALREGRGK
ncbi:MAG: type II toxin-antitoxin system Phd/YefM family antitoxin [Patescibacteria group bacterium]